MGQLRGWIRHLPWWGQVFAWPLLYIPVWAVVQILSVIGWLLTELYNQTAHALQRFAHRYFWIIVGVVLAGGILLLAPEAFGPLLQLGIIVALLWAAVIFMWRGAFPKKKKKSGQNH